MQGYLCADFEPATTAVISEAFIINITYCQHSIIPPVVKIILFPIPLYPLDCIPYYSIWLEVAAIPIIIPVDIIKNVVGRIRTCAGKPNRFLVCLLNHSDTTTYWWTWFKILKIITFWSNKKIKGKNRWVKQQQ